MFTGSAIPAPQPGELSVGPPIGLARVKNVLTDAAHRHAELGGSYHLLKIAGDAAFFPIAESYGIRTVPTAHLLRLGDGLGAPALFRFSERALSLRC
jgi:hypothetical protein